MTSYHVNAYHVFVPRDSLGRRKQKWVASTRAPADALSIALTYEGAFISLVRSNSPYLRKKYTVWTRGKDPEELGEAVQLIRFREA